MLAPPRARRESPPDEFLNRGHLHAGQTRERHGVDQLSIGQLKLGPHVSPVVVSLVLQRLQSDTTVDVGSLHQDRGVLANNGNVPLVV